jgi:hypothetical protein
MWRVGCHKCLEALPVLGRSVEACAACCTRTDIQQCRENAPRRLGLATSAFSSRARICCPPPRISQVEPREQAVQVLFFGRPGFDALVHHAPLKASRSTFQHVGHRQAAAHE